MDLVVQMELEPYAPRITVPSLVVKACRDRVCPPEMIDAFFARIPEPKELMALDCGHVDVLLRRMPSVLSASVGFFGRRLDSIGPTMNRDVVVTGQVVPSA